MSCNLGINVYAVAAISFTLILILAKLFVEFTKGHARCNTCLVGKTALITGANSGLGYQTALALAARGGRIIIADKDDACQAKNKIIEETGNTNIVTKRFDLSSLESVRKLAREINEEEGRLDILINNAGVGAIDEVLSNDGLPLHMQINHLGPFLLTHLLTGLLKKSTPSRIIFVSSFLSFINNLTIAELSKNISNRTISYANTKLCNIITSNILAEKLKETGVTCNAVHPGAVSTPIFAKSLILKGDNYVKALIYFFLKFFGKTPLEGAQTQIYCALSKDLICRSGRFFSDCRPFLQPFSTRNKNFCYEIWKKSEELVKLLPNEIL